MDFKQIQELIKLVNRSNIGELCIEQNDFKIVIKQKEEQQQVQTIVAAPQPMTMLAPQPQTVVPAPMPPSPASQDAASAGADAAAGSAAPKADNYITIKSPMIGTFYRRPSPDKPIFVEIGDEVAPGKVVCIIEAMKLFNEIESEVSGKIVKILVENASPVEYDQPLFLVEPA
jgi:acetyl-CoA carboxylase biotin carboxyl carrier protein